MIVEQQTKKQNKNAFEKKQDSFVYLVVYGTFPLRTKTNRMTNYLILNFSATTMRILQRILIDECELLINILSLINNDALIVCLTKFNQLCIWKGKSKLKMFQFLFVVERSRWHRKRFCIDMRYKCFFLHVLHLLSLEFAQVTEKSLWSPFLGNCKHFTHFNCVTFPYAIKETS